MYRVKKIALAAALVIVLGLPLLIWGQSALSKRGLHPEGAPQPPMYNSMDREVNLW